MSVKLTIVRHGESVDNLGDVWAGSKDAPLSNHGMNQAKAVGAAFKDTPITHVYASPLLRARWTAEQIHKQNTASPDLQPITFSPLLQEQHFGQAEGQSWEKAEWVRESTRSFSFPDGESLEDVAARTEKGLDTFILPHVKEAARTGEDRHIVLVAHGIHNSEMIGTLLRRRTNDRNLGKNDCRTGPMTNTGFHTLKLSLADAPGNPPAVDASASATPATTNTNPSSVPPVSAPSTPLDSERPHLQVQLQSINSTVHLDGVKRQAGGIGSSAFDVKQQSMRDFISGGGSSKV